MGFRREGWKHSSSIWLAIFIISNACGRSSALEPRSQPSLCGQEDVDCLEALAALSPGDSVQFLQSEARVHTVHLGSSPVNASTGPMMRHLPRDPQEDVAGGIYGSPPRELHDFTWQTNSHGKLEPHWKFVLLLLSIIFVPCALAGSYGRNAQESGRAAQRGAPHDVVSASRRLEARRTFAEDPARVRTTVFIASLLHFCMNYNTGIIAGALLYIQSDKLFAPIDTWTLGAIVSFMLIGAAMGAICGSIAEWIGRKVALLGVALMYVFGAFVMCTASTVEVLAAGRAIAGFGVGLSSGLVNLYISEILPSESCGPHLTLWAPFMGTLGLVTSHAVSLLCGFLPGGAWRTQLGLGMVPALVVLLLGRLLPESPRWLLMQGQREDARLSFEALFPNVMDRVIDDELDRIESDLGLWTRGRFGLWATCTEHPKAFAIGIAANVVQQATGINVIVYFGPTVLCMAGFSKTLAMMVTVAISVAHYCAVLSNSGIVERSGRRSITIAGIFVILVGVGLVIVGLLFRSSSVLRIWHPWIVVAGMFLWRAAFSLSLSPLPHIMTSEFFPQEARGMGVAMTWMANWIANFVVCQSFPVAEGRLVEFFLDDGKASALIFMVFFVFTILALVFVVVCLPDAGQRQRSK